MTLIEFLRSLSWELNMYDVLIIWKWENRCPVCGKYYQVEDDEFSCEGYTVSDYRKDSVEHLMGYPEVYETNIDQYEIIFESMKITILHIEYGSDHICEDCVVG